MNTITYLLLTHRKCKPITSASSSRCLHPASTSSELGRRRSQDLAICAKKIKTSCSSRLVSSYSLFASPTGITPQNCLFKGPNEWRDWLATFSYRVRLEEEKFIFDNGVVLHSSQCKPSFGPWHSTIIDFAHSLHAMDIDLSAFACLVALTLVTGKSRQELVRVFALSQTPWK